MIGHTHHKTTDDKDHITLNKPTNHNKSILTKNADESTSDDIFPTLKRPLPSLNKKAIVTSNSHQENDVKKDVIPKSIFPPTFSSRLIHKIPPNFSQLNPVVTDVFPKSDLNDNPSPLKGVDQPEDKTNLTVSPSNSTFNIADTTLLNNTTEITNSTADVTKNSTLSDVTNNQSNSSLVSQQVTYIPLNQTNFNSTQTNIVNNTLLTNQTDSTDSSTNQTLATNQTLPYTVDSTAKSLQSNQSNIQPINITETTPLLKSNQSNIEPINITGTTAFLKLNQTNFEPMNNTETPSLKSNQSNTDPLVASWRQYFPSFFPSSPSQNTNQENSQLRADVIGPTNPGHTDEIKMGEYCKVCLLYTSPSPRDKRQSRMPSSA